MQVFALWYVSSIKQPKKISLFLGCLTLKMKALCYSEVLVTVYKQT